MKTHFTWISATYEVEVNGEPEDMITIEVREDFPILGIDLKRKAWEAARVILAKRLGQVTFKHALLQAHMK